jgi:hypothetical protein
MKRSTKKWTQISGKNGQDAISVSDLALRNPFHVKIADDAELPRMKSECDLNAHVLQGCPKIYFHSKINNLE